MPEAAIVQPARRGTVAIYAAACGVMVGNLYLCQPLLDEIARALGVSEPAAGLVSVTTQVGYGLGILFLVPLADTSDPRRLVRWLVLATAAGLLGAAAAPGLWALIAASLLFAAATVVPQILVPLATALVPPERRGRVIAALQTGFILGILLSRTVAGAVAAATGTWRAPFLLAAALTGAVLLVLPPHLPAGSGRHTGSYGALLRSLLPLLRERALRTSVVLGFCLFGAFSAFWSTLAFHLASPTFGLGAAATGLFGVWGAPGALIAPLGGRLADRVGSGWVNAASLLCAGAAFAVAGWFGGASLLALVVTVNLLDFGLQTGQIANQTRIFTLGAEWRARLNTVYMVAVFSGAAFGSLGGTTMWYWAGWSGVCEFAIGLVTVAALALAMSSRHG